VTTFQSFLEVTTERGSSLDRAAMERTRQISYRQFGNNSRDHDDTNSAG